MTLYIIQDKQDLNIDGFWDRLENGVWVNRGGFLLSKAGQWMAWTDFFVAGDQIRLRNRLDITPADVEFVYGNSVGINEIIFTMSDNSVVYAHKAPVTPPPSCIMDSDCPTGYVCQGGVCVLAPVPPKQCPSWMLKAWNIATKRNLKLVQDVLSNRAERKKCSLQV